MSKVLEDEKGFQCPYAHSFVKRGMYGPLVLSTIVVGIILLVTGSVLFAYALYRRTRVSFLSLTAFLCCICVIIIIAYLFTCLFVFAFCQYTMV